MKKLPLHTKNLPLKTRTQTTANGLMKQLRDAAAPPGKAPLWLAYLPDDKLAEVYHRLMMGQNVTHIVRTIQERWHLGRELNPQSLHNTVTKFRERCMPDMKKLKTDLTQAVADDPDLSPKALALQKRLERRASKLCGKLDSMQMFANLILDHYDHYQLMRIREEDGGIASKHTDKAGEVLKGMIDAYIDQERKLGLRDQEPSKIKLEIKAKLEGLIGKTDDGGQHMLEMAQSFLDIAKPKCIQLEALPDGTYRLPNPANNQD